VHGDAEAAREPLDEAGLPRAERADERDDVAWAERVAEPLAGGRGVLGAPAQDLSRPRR
jgi:hypothetical protein